MRTKLFSIPEVVDKEEEEDGDHTSCAGQDHVFTDDGNGNVDVDADGNGHANHGHILPFFSSIDDDEEKDPSESPYTIPPLSIMSSTKARDKVVEPPPIRTKQFASRQQPQQPTVTSREPPPPPPPPTLSSRRSYEQYRQEIERQKRLLQYKRQRQQHNASLNFAATTAVAAITNTPTLSAKAKTWQGQTVSSENFLINVEIISRKLKASSSKSANHGELPTPAVMDKWFCSITAKLSPTKVPPVTANSAKATTRSEWASNDNYYYAGDNHDSFVATFSSAGTVVSASSSPASSLHGRKWGPSERAPKKLAYLKHRKRLLELKWKKEKSTELGSLFLEQAASEGDRKIEQYAETARSEDNPSFAETLVQPLSSTATKFGADVFRRSASHLTMPKRPVPGIAPALKSDSLAKESDTHKVLLEQEGPGTPKRSNRRTVRFAASVSVWPDHDSVDKEKRGPDDWLSNVVQSPAPDPAKIPMISKDVPNDDDVGSNQSTGADDNDSALDLSKAVLGHSSRDSLSTANELSVVDEALDAIQTLLDRLGGSTAISKSTKRNELAASASSPISSSLTEPYVSRSKRTEASSKSEAQRRKKCSFSKPSQRKISLATHSTKRDADSDNSFDYGGALEALVQQMSVEASKRDGVIIES